MGFADAIEQLGYAYDSEPAYDFADKIFEFVSYMAIDERPDLAFRSSQSISRISRDHDGPPTLVADRFHCHLFEEEDRGCPRHCRQGVSKHKGLNWDVLGAKAQAECEELQLSWPLRPNAGYRPCRQHDSYGIDRQVRADILPARSTRKISGHQHNLVNDLKNLGLWERSKGPHSMSQGDISNIEAIPQSVRDHLQERLHHFAVPHIEVAAFAPRNGSVNHCRATCIGDARHLTEPCAIYPNAWEKGLKSTYYFACRPRHTAEQSSHHVSKAEKHRPHRIWRSLCKA